MKKNDENMYSIIVSCAIMQSRNLKEQKMSNIKVDGQLIENDVIFDISGFGKQEDQIIFWQTETANDKIKYEFDLKNNILIKDSTELQIIFSFQHNKETQAEILIKEIGSVCYVPFVTKMIKKDQNIIEIEYQIINEQSTRKIFFSFQNEI